MINLPTLRQLQYLLQLYETRNFGKAASACFITQPTLSQAMIEMENLLGTKVLDRSKRKIVAFTPFGLDVIQTIQKIMPDLENMMQNAKQSQEPLSGIMRLGLIPTIAPYLLPNFLPTLQEKFKKMDFQITEAMSHQLIDKLNEGKLDIVIMALPYETRGFKNIKLYDEHFYLAAPKNIFPSDKKLNIEDIDNKNLLLLQDGHCLRDHILSACKKSDMVGTQPLQVTSLYTLIQMVGQGYGVTLLPEMVVKQGNMPKTVQIYAFKKPVPSREIGLVYQDKTYKKDNIKAVNNALSQILKR